MPGSFSGGRYPVCLHLACLPWERISLPEVSSLNFPSTGSPPSAFLLFSSSVTSNSLKPHGSQHARIPCPSLSPRACSNSCPVSQSHHPTVSPLCLLAPNPHLSLYRVDFSTLTAPSPPTSPPRPAQWTCWVLTTRPLGNSQVLLF